MKFVFNGLNVVFLSMLVLVMASCGGAEDRKVKYLEKGKGYLQENKLDKARIELKKCASN